jgi:4a-hydroxytetrahydrobiopterin dehydratase
MDNEMTELARKTCIPCSGKVPALIGDQIQPMLAALDQWLVENNRHLTRTFRFPDFAKALAFVNRVGEIAEAQNHHPDVCLSWGQVRLEIWTHKVDGFTENDFILAAKIDELVRQS